MRNTFFRLVALAVLALPSSFAATMVGVELQLLIDVSGSISAAEYALQRDGYAAAFMDPVVIANIENQPGGIAVQVIQWAGVTQQKISIDWTHLQNGTDSKAFAASIAKMPRAFVGGRTAVQAALLFGSTQFAGNEFIGKKLISDVSGDGACNDPRAGCGVGGQAAMAKAGVLVNGLVIGGDPAVEAYYASDVVTFGGVVYKASSFADFEKAIIAKIRAETSTDVPEPSSWTIATAGLAGLLVSARRRRAA